MTDIFKNLVETEEFREEFFVAEAQTQLSELMDRVGITRAELARKLGVSRARVTQIFSDEATNLTLRLLYRSYAALGDEPVIISKREYDRLKSGRSEPAMRRRQMAFPGELPEELVAELLKAALPKESAQSERKRRRSDTQEKWASQGSNVVPIRSAANGR